MTKRSFSFYVDEKIREVCNRWMDKAGIENRGDCSRKINRAIRILDMIERDSFERLNDEEQILFLAHYCRMTEILLSIKFLDRKRRDSFRERYDTVQGLMNDMANNSNTLNHDI